ncbi:MAG: AsmA-like C-terminal domain-containing protein [Nitrospirae bacterium]|nr:AsmA-like C-terminal domain-containing protein [Nitrospirota bacterium]
MAVRRRPLVLGLLAVLLLVVSIASFPFLYHPDYIVQLLLQQVEHQLGRKIEVGQAHLGIFPRIRLELTDVVIRDIEPSRVFFKAQRFDMVLRSTPLMRLQVVVKRLAVEQPQVELRRDRTGRWNFLFGPSATTVEDKLGRNPLGLVLHIQETALTNGEITIIDEFRPDGVRSVRLGALDAVMATGTKGVLADLRLSATIPGTSGVSSLSLVGKVTQAESPVKIGLEDALGMVPALQFEGMVEALNVDIRQLADFFGPRPVPDKLYGAANLRGQIRMVPGVAGYDMVLSDMKAHVEHLSIKGQASLSGLMTAQPTFSLTVSTSSISLEELFDRVPVQWLHPQLEAVIKEREIRGTVEVVTATVTGTTKPDPRVSVTGEFRLHQGHALVGSDRTPAQNVSGTVIVEADRIRVTDLTGMYGAMRVSGGKATVFFQEAGPRLELEVGGDMAAADLVVFLAGTVRPERLSRSLAALREIRGDALLTFRIAGSLTQPDGLNFVGGEIVPRDVSFQSPVVAERVVGLKGRVLFSPKGVEFDKLGGRLGQGQFEVHGTIASGDTDAFQRFTVWAKLDPGQMVRLLPSGSLPSATLDGTMEANVSLSGPTDAPQFKGTVELKTTGVVVPGIMQKPAGAPASIQFEGNLSRGAVLSMDRFELAIPPVRLAGKGTMRMGAKFSVDASLVSGPIDLSKLPSVISLLGGVKAGTLEVSLDVKGKEKNWKAWRVNGWVAITDGQVATKQLTHPVKDLYLRLKLVRNGAELKRLAFKINGSDVGISGVIRNWNRKPTIELKVESSQLDLALLIPKGKRSPVRDALEELAATSRLVATVGINRGTYKALTFTELSGRVNIRDGVLDVDRLSGQSDGGRVAGRLVVLLPKRKPAEVEVSVRITGMPFVKVSQLTGDEKRLVSGELSASGTVQGNGKNPRGVLNTLNGNVEVLIKQGRVQKGTIVPKILMMLNLPSLLQGKVDLTRDGMPFDKITGSVSIRNGLVTSENIVVDSPVIKITGAGNYDLTTDQLDLVMAVSPLGSYSQLLKSIPLFGKLFAGERQGIDTALFEVKGSLQDPKVTYLPLRSFATGLTGLAHLAFDVLKNAIMLPKELIAPSEKPPSPPPPGERPLPERAVPGGEKPESREKVPASPSPATDQVTPPQPREPVPQPAAPAPNSP